MNPTLDAGRRNIVVIGSSAGGIEALKTLFSGLSYSSGASFFVVQHLSPHSTSHLDRILQSVTAMRVAFASDGEAIAPDTVYIAPPDCHLMIERDRVRVTRGPKECRTRPAVDVLFRSAALAHGPRVIGVILSGALDDGTAGLWQVKDRQGIALVQDPREAAHSSMPESAIEHVEVDCVGTVASLVALIGRETAGNMPEAAATTTAAGRALRVENLIAMEGNGMHAGVMELGKVSKYTCPDCHGVLVQIEEGSIVRFRCHTGHAYSIKSLLAEVNIAIDNGLWDAIRAIEERIFLLRQNADLAAAAGKDAKAAGLRAKADVAEEKYQPLRKLVLDVDFFTNE